MNRSTFNYIIIMIILFTMHYPTNVFPNVPKLESNSSYINHNLQYEMIGFEKRNTRFWVVTDVELVQSQKFMNKIILDIYQKHKKKLNLNSIDWNISFFSSITAAGYKTFKANEYLA